MSKAARGGVEIKGQPECDCQAGWLPTCHPAAGRSWLPDGGKVTSESDSASGACATPRQQAKAADCRVAVHTADGNSRLQDGCPCNVEVIHASD